MKCAVYVEGKSELLFVADILQKYFGYDSGRCGFRCHNLNADDLKRINNPRLGDENSEYFYRIVNVNNDSRVVSKLREDIPDLLNQGYDVIIGLRDVFGENYDSLMKGQPEINRELIERMHKAQTKALKAPEGSDCRLHFAIMEYETWMFALMENVAQSNQASIVDICKKLDIDWADDFELTMYHPYDYVKKVFQAFGKDYNKHESEIYSFLSTLTVDDYEHLRQSGKCASFRKFMESLLGLSIPQLP